MVISAFECLKRANITLKCAYDVKPAFFVNINARRSLKTFKKIPGTGNVVTSLTTFREKIEEYVYELQKY